MINKLTQTTKLLEWMETINSVIDSVNSDESVPPLDDSIFDKDENGNYTIPVFSSEKAGLVPASGSAGNNMFLSADKTWKEINIQEPPVVITTPVLTLDTNVAIGNTVTFTATSKSLLENQKILYHILEIPVLSIKNTVSANSEGTSEITFQIPSGIASGTKYQVSVTAYDNLGNASTPANVEIVAYDSFVHAPSIILPEENATIGTKNIRIVTSEFSVFGNPDTHSASQFRICKASDSSVLWDSGESTENLTDYLADISTLNASIDYAAGYYIEARYKGASAGWSGWSSKRNISIFKQEFARGNYLVRNMNTFIAVDNLSKVPENPSILPKYCEYLRDFNKFQDYIYYLNTSETTDTDLVLARTKDNKTFENVHIPVTSNFYSPDRYFLTLRNSIVISDNVIFFTNFDNSGSTYNIIVKKSTNGTTFEDLVTISTSLSTSKSLSIDTNIDLDEDNLAILLLYYDSETTKYHTHIVNCQTGSKNSSLSYTGTTTLVPGRATNGIIIYNKTTGVSIATSGSQSIITSNIGSSYITEYMYVHENNLYLLDNTNKKYHIYDIQAQSLKSRDISSNVLPSHTISIYDIKNKKFRYFYRNYEIYFDDSTSKYTASSYMDIYNGCINSSDSLFIFLHDGNVHIQQTGTTFSIKDKKINLDNTSWTIIENDKFNIDVSRYNNVAYFNNEVVITCFNPNTTMLNIGKLKNDGSVEYLQSNYKNGYTTMLFPIKNVLKTSQYYIDTDFNMIETPGFSANYHIMKKVMDIIFLSYTCTTTDGKTNQTVSNPIYGVVPIEFDNQIYGIAYDNNSFVLQKYENGSYVNVASKAYKNSFSSNIQFIAEAMNNRIIYIVNNKYYAKPYILKYESGNLTVDNDTHPTFFINNVNKLPFLKKIDNELYLFHRETKTIYKWDDAQSKFVDAGFPFYGEIFKLGEE